ncbi:MAG: hypothetical protein CVU64_18120 [Deltaproteobacteria bacterium HGW-Deltaproteobacteria-21]|nr:MAG: hypothetical protein CVU64_18120 [Deltaproteobacteria bacterium HGW-Deltaproteobacteria-21]
MKDSVQRVIDTIRHGSCDRIPRGEITIDDSVVENALACGSVGFDERLQFSSLLGLDIYCLSPQHIHSGDLPQPGDLVWPDLRSWVDRSGLFTFAILDGSFGWGGRILGFEKFFGLCMRDKAALRDFNRGVETLNRNLGRLLADEGIHGLVLADDLAYTSGLFVSPGTMEEHFLPCLSGQAENLLSLGLPLFFHSDGNYLDILARIAAMGFHGFHCIDPDSNMDVAEVRSRAGRDLCLWGTLSARELERCGGSKECEGMITTIRNAASAGPFILGTTSGLFKGLRIGELQSIYSRI